MSAARSAKQAELDALRRPFIAGVVGVVAVMLALGGLLAVASHRKPRPEGVAEQWLNAISDSTRKGVGDDALRRAYERGRPGAEKPLLPTSFVDGKTAFTAIEVGRARLGVASLPTTVAGAPQQPTRLAEVPFRVDQRPVGDAKAKTLHGTISLGADVRGEWRVEGVTVLAEPLGDAPRVPSEGGAPPSRAPAALWVGAIVAGCLVAAGAAGLVHLAGREAQRRGLAGAGG